ncbi:MAG: hypothetical protein WCP20_08040 [Desulfuromonadales bacterium]
MLPMYEGMPEFIDFAVDLVKRKPYRDSLAIVAYHFLAEVVDDATHALRHYLTLTLSEPYLQNSHHGSPYKKWAYVNNDNFNRLDQHIKMLIPFIESIHAETRTLKGDSKSPYRWLDTVRDEYVSCKVDPDEPIFTMSSISFKGWFDGNNWNNLRPLEEFPVVTSFSVSIEDRSVLSEIQHVGLERVGLMKASLTQLAGWLQKNYTMHDITTRRETRWDVGAL